MKCPKCETVNPADSKFCKECATPLPSPSFTRTMEMPADELARGTVFAGRYEIIEELGEGGMGKVYRAHDTKLNEEVALKLIKPEIAADKRTVERFHNEIKIARKISHKNVCRTHDLHEEGRTLYLTMEYVRGEDLKSLIHRTKTLSVGTALAIARQMAEGLAEAHKLGIVHRDLKPGNVMIDKDGQAKIMDFGVARAMREKGITGAGAIIGTPEYMSPEQVEGKEADQRADIYALGIILFEMVTGRVPFEGETAFRIAMKQKEEAPKNPQLLNPNLPDDLAGVILKCLEMDPAKRYLSAADVRAELERVEQGLPTIERAAPKRATPLRKASTSKEITVKFAPQRLVIPALAVVAVIIASYFLLRSRPAKTPAVSTSIPSGSAGPTPSGLDPTRVVVSLFENRTGNADLDTVALLAADSLTRALLQSGEAGVATNPALASGVGSLRKSPAGQSISDALHALAVQTGAGLVVTGALYPGRYIPTYEAYQEAERGSAALGIDYDAAHRHFELALKLDPSWIALRLSISSALTDRNMYREAAAQLSLLESHVGALTPYDQQRLRMNRAWLKGKYSEALQASLERDRLTPGLMSDTG